MHLIVRKILLVSNLGNGEYAYLCKGSASIVTTLTDNKVLRYLFFIVKMFMMLICYTLFHFPFTHFTALFSLIQKLL